MMLNMMVDMVDEAVFYSFILYGSLLSFWWLMKYPLTFLVKNKNQVYSNPEDIMVRPGGKYTTSNPDVVRVNRMHMNDIENITPFIFLGLIFCFTCGSSVSVQTSVWLFRLFAAGRMGASVCHFFKLQPFRSLFFLLAMACNVTLAFFIMRKMLFYSEAVKYM